MSLNQFIAMGRLVANPELKTTQSGKYTTKFTIAIDRDFKDENGERKADFATFIAWDKTAELVCQYFTKGRMIAITAQFRNNIWTDKQGTKHYDYTFEARSVSFCGDKAQDTAQTPQQPQQPQRQYAAPAQQNTPQNAAPNPYYTPSTLTANEMPQFEMISDDELPFDIGLSHL